MKSFNKIIENQFGIVYGSDTVIFIKTGRGGDIYGYDNKYMNIAGMLHDRYGIAVPVGSLQYQSQAADCQ